MTAPLQRGNGGGAKDFPWPAPPYFEFVRENDGSGWGDCRLTFRDGTKAIGWVHTFLEPVFFKVEKEPFLWAGEGGLLMLASLATVFVGIYIAWVMYVRRTELPGRLAERVPVLYKASFNKMYMDEVYEAVPIRSTIAFSMWLWTFVDAKVIDGAVNGLARLWELAGERLRPLQTGRVQNYAFSILAGMLVLVVVLAWVWGS